MPLRLAPLERARRAEVRGILERSGAFAVDEIAVALELFDETFGGAGSPPAAAALGAGSALRASPGSGVAGLRPARLSNPEREGVAAEPRASAAKALPGERAAAAASDPAPSRAAAGREGAPGGGADSAERAPDYEFAGAYDAGDALRGYACWGPTPGAERTYDLYWIAVDPGAQGVGGGTLLLAEVERRLAGRRARMVVVETSSRPEYEGARGFYARRGYQEAARVREFYAPGDDRIILTKRIEQRGS